MQEARFWPKDTKAKVVELLSKGPSKSRKMAAEVEFCSVQTSNDELRIFFLAHIASIIMISHQKSAKIL